MLPQTHKDLPHASDLLDLSEFLVAVADGRIVDAHDFAALRRASGPTEAAGIWAYTLALIHVHAGAHGKAEDLAELAVRQLEWRDSTGLVGCARALSATTAALVGDVDLARTRLAELPAASLQDVKTVLQRAEVLAWLDVSAGRREEAAQRLRAAVEQALAQEHDVLAAITATIAIRIGMPNAVFDVLKKSTSERSSEIFTAVCQAADAASREDHAVAVSLTSRLRAAGLDAFALHLCSVAAAQSSDAMIRRRTLLVCAELNESASADPALRQSQTKTLRVGLLSRRELEIAHLAARRIRSRHIAEQLGVSVRTVENRLGNIYRKLEVNGREELAALEVKSP
ncbi:helix-turn-helix transcriptional regulator [Microbacterium halimionae]|nr:LuxR family transcriptional regulator [Microbacterium halimionae]